MVTVAPQVEGGREAGGRLVGVIDVAGGAGLHGFDNGKPVA
ncbi:hypothetical protein ACWDA9_09010 [Streptomyces sp. NPDC001193]